MICVYTLLTEYATIWHLIDKLFVRYVHLCLSRIYLVYCYLVTFAHYFALFIVSGSCIIYYVL